MTEIIKANKPFQRSEMTREKAIEFFRQRGEDYKCEMIQGFVMKTYEKFLGIVARERNLPADALRNGIADGRILSGRDALENKLIDGTGQIEDAFAKAKELSRAPGATVVKYGPRFSLSRFFRAFGSTNNKIELTLPSQLMPQLETGRAYFLPSFYAP